VAQARDGEKLGDALEQPDDNRLGIGQVGHRLSSIPSARRHTAQHSV
jgi:hypothetical protein